MLFGVPSPLIPPFIPTYIAMMLSRHGTELPTLLKIRSAFPQWPPSQTTGGNASQNSDGAAAVLLMRRDKAEELGLRIIAKFVTTAVVGVPPRVMGIGPAYAIPAVLKATGLTKEDVDLFEVRCLVSLSLIVSFTPRLIYAS